MSQQITLRGIAAAEPLRAPPRNALRESEAPAAAAPQGMSPPNPSMRLDSELGMVVIEFRSATGEVTESLPTPREMDAYRMAALTSRKADDPVVTAATPTPVAGLPKGGAEPGAPPPAMAGAPAAAERQAPAAAPRPALASHSL